MMQYSALFTWAITASLASSLAMLAGAQPVTDPAASTPGFDAETGRDLRNYPPHLPADIRHMKLELFIENMNTPRLEGTQFLSITPTARALETLTLDAQAMEVKTVRVDGLPANAAKFEHDGRTLTITFTPPLPEGQEATVITTYALDDPPRGLIWTPESPAWPGRAAQLHTQGQPETNSFWFPCVDFPNDRMTTEIIATAPAGFEVSSNGRLLSRTRKIVTNETGVGTRRLGAYEQHHWLQDKEHVPYLVTLVVGKFDVVELGTPADAPKLSMPVYAPVGRGQDVAASFGNTPRMVDFFEDLLDEPYPWDRYAQLLVWNFGSGGMENTSATTLHDNAVIEPSALLDHDPESLIAHELAHQWFGDLLTCNSWEHIWLNEGFATYLTHLWFEHKDGTAAYEARMREAFDGVLAADTTGAPSASAMASKEYFHPWETFRRPANPYGKGACVLHMLRARLGHEAFNRGIAAYIDQHRQQTVETYDLRRTLEETSGESLEQFFAQWVLRPGTPSLTVTPTWDEPSQTLTIRTEQTQPIDGDNPAFEFTLPIFIDAKGNRRTIEFAVNARSNEATVQLEHPPTMIAVDPGLTVLANITVIQDADRWLKQLANGPTLNARIQAARGLRSDVTMQTVEVLRRLTTDRSQPVPLRVEAVRSLAARNAVADVRGLVTTASDDWQLRMATTEAVTSIALRTDADLSQDARDSIAAMLADRAQKDRSIKVRAASLVALGRLQAAQHQRVINAALEVPSHADVVRQGALESLAHLKPADGVRLAAKYVGPGYDGRTRARAAANLGELASIDRDGAYAALRTALRDRELRVQRAAGEALVALGDERALTDFERVSKQARAQEWREDLDRWAEALRAKLSVKSGG
jgi:aminopeptidase N